MSLIGTRSPKLNESGQAVVEYILVMMISVILVSTVVYQFSTAFRKYANNFFGDYIMCLIESGELPGQVGECKELFAAFNIRDGKTASGGQYDDPSNGGGGSGSGSSSNSTNGKISSNSKSGGSGSDKSTSSDSKSAAAPPVGELGSSGGDSGSFGGRKRASTSVKTAPAPGSSDGKGREGLRPIGALASSSDSSGGNGSGRKKALDSGNGYAGQDAANDREKERPITKSVATEGGDRLRPKKVSVNTSRAPAAASDADVGGFTFGAFLKFLLIAGILIAIFILFGGQLLAISKSGEK